VGGGGGRAAANKQQQLSVLHFISQIKKRRLLLTVLRDNYFMVANTAKLNITTLPNPSSSHLWNDLSVVYHVFNVNTLKKGIAGYGKLENLHQRLKAQAQDPNEPI
jgi:hypothetical protein